MRMIDSDTRPIDERFVDRFARNQAFQLLQERGVPVQNPSGNNPDTEYKISDDIIWGGVIAHLYVHGVLNPERTSVDSFSIQVNFQTNKGDDYKTEPTELAYLRKGVMSSPEEAKKVAQAIQLLRR